MSLPPPYLFQLEDGGSLSLAVHSEIPQYHRICEIIHANRGFVVEEASAADFCILSPVLTDADGIAEELRAGGKLAIQDYWIRDSMDAGQLLPWYSYQIGGSSSVVKTIGKDPSSTLAVEAEERDVHELVATSARYWPLLSEEELCRYVSRKCPHRSATSFRDLYTLHQSDIDSRVLYLRGRLESAFTFDNNFSRRPRMSFGSPNKVGRLSMKAPSSSSVHMTPTPSATTRGEDIEMMIPDNTAETSHTIIDEIPVETPSVDDAADSSPVHGTSAQARVTAERPRGKRGSANSDDVIALQLLPTSRSTISAPTEPPVRKGGPISPEEFQALAMFLFENPWTNSKVGYNAHFEKFRQTNPLARHRAARAWREAFDRHPLKVKGLIRDIAYNASSSVAHGSVTRAKAQTKNKPPLQGVKISEEDKQALAVWLLDNPRGPPSTNQPYFERFMAHHQHLAPRGWDTWRNAVNNHKDDITARQHTIKQRRRKSQKRRKPSVSSNSELSSADSSEFIPQ